MVIIRRTNAFLRDYQGLPVELRRQVDKQLHLLFEDFRHPSLRMKKLSGTDKFEIRISKGYRLTFRLEKDLVELRRVGTHDILRDEGLKDFC
jgi:mRNA-degrading endonuclease RelE of RelBE toxin-antitoxin system